jgi:(p)ppGpp synthase/HD superfamily hydrolase
VISPDEAELLAGRLLSGLRTKTGGSHLAHARRVADRVQVEAPCGFDTEDGRAVAAALLHDVVEKAGVSIEQLRMVTDDDRVVELVQLLTQRIGESDRSYLARCAGDPTALVIKRLDLLDKFVVSDATAPPEVIARVHWRARRRLTLLERMVDDLPPVPMTRESVAAAVPPSWG